MYKTHISRIFITVFISITILFTSSTLTMAADFSSAAEEAAPDVAVTEESMITEEDVFTEEAAPEVTEESADEVEPFEDGTDIPAADVTGEDTEPDSIAAESIDAEEADDAIVGSDNVQDPTVYDTEKSSYYSGGSGNKEEWEGAAVSPFPDIKDSSHAYYDAICWAGNNAISKGFSDGSFRMSQSCTRGAAMMFIWRFMGNPSPKSVSKSPFSDVPKTHAYYRAILWAWQNGITKGYSNGKFGINTRCSRGDVMMFLWRCAGKSAPSASATSPFSDIKASHAYYKAVLWGSQTGITKGYSDGTFGVTKSCTRGHIVMFLYRYFLNNFYTVKMSNGKVLSINSPFSKSQGAYYETVMTNNKTMITVPTIPQKVLFIGNSLLQGMGSAAKGGRFGMCATDSQNDYYYHVTQAILKKNASATFAKLSGTAFEGSTDSATARKWYEKQRGYFTEDLNLIVIQLGDNVNTDAKRAAFAENIGPLLMQIKNDCPKARIICVGTWYHNPKVVNNFISACKKTGCDFIRITNLYCAATIPAAGTVITYNDGSQAVATGGSLTHPNNYGMQLIAQRIISIMNMG